MGSAKAHFCRGRAAGRLLSGIGGVAIVQLRANLPSAQETKVLNSATATSAGGLPVGNSPVLIADMTVAPSMRALIVQFVDANGNGDQIRFKNSATTDTTVIFNGTSAYGTGGTSTYPYQIADILPPAALTTRLRVERRDGFLFVYADSGNGLELIGSREGFTTPVGFIRVVHLTGSGSNLVTATYGGLIDPLTIAGTAKFDDTFRLQFGVYYSAPQGVSSYSPLVQMYREDGVTPFGPKMVAELVSNTTDGYAVFKTQNSAAAVLYNTSPKFDVIETNANGTERSGKARGFAVMPAGPLIAGNNIASLGGRFDLFTSYANHFAAGNWGTTIGDATTSPPYLDVDGMPLDNAGGSTHLVRRFKQPAVACTMEISWTQTTGTDAVWKSVSGGLPIGTITPMAVEGGRRRAQFTVTPGAESTAGIQLELFSFPAGDPPKAITCYVVGADKTKILTPTRRALNSGWSVQRFMDEKNVNGNAVAVGGTPRSWADRSKAFSLKGAQDGVDDETMCAILNELGNDLWFNIPLYWNDDYYLNILPLLDSLLAPGKKIYLEWGNELTNPNLAGGVTFSAIKSRYVARTGNAYLGDSGGGVQQVIDEIAYENKRVFNLMQSTIPNFSTRVVRVNANFSGLFEYNRKKLTGGFTEYDFVTSNAIYVVPPASIPDQSPAGIKAAWLPAMNTVVDEQLKVRDAARADGKRFGCYEVGTDWKRGGAQGAALKAFQRSQEKYDCEYALWNRLRLEFGDLWALYFDVGLVGSTISWAVAESDVLPKPGYDGIMAVKALPALT